MEPFSQEIATGRIEQVVDQLARVDRGQVERVLGSSKASIRDAHILLSPAASGFLEAMARKAQSITRARFGRTMALYAPLYLSNYCQNHCSYCGFSANRDVPRSSLSLDEAVAQAELLLSQGIRHLLLVTGEAPAKYGLDDLVQVCRALRPKVASLSIEVFPSDDEGYGALSQAGVDGLVIYQETYDRRRYGELHPRGPKRDFDKRLAAMEAGGRAGFRSLGIGSLLGMADPRVEACFMAHHGAYLTRRFPEARLAVSFPRLRPVPGGTSISHPVDDALLVQFIVAMRLLFPDAELVLSTRESAHMRDQLMGLGITRMSAGSKTSPGGYGSGIDTQSAGQFDIDDDRTVAQVIEAVSQAGFDVVTKDFDPVFMVPGEGL